MLLLLLLLLPSLVAYPHRVLVTVAVAPNLLLLPLWPPSPRPPSLISTSTGADLWPAALVMMLLLLNLMSASMTRCVCL